MTLTPNNPFSSPRGMPLPAGVDRRQAPRIQPVSPNAYNTAGAMGARTSTLEELKQKSRKAGEASFFYFDHHFQYNAVKVLPGDYDGAGVVHCRLHLGQPFLGGGNEPLHAA